MCQCMNSVPCIVIEVTAKSTVALLDEIAKYDLQCDVRDSDEGLKTVYVLEPFPLDVSTFSGMPVVGIMSVRDGAEVEKHIHFAYV